MAIISDCATGRVVAFPRKNARDVTELSALSRRMSDVGVGVFFETAKTVSGADLDGSGTRLELIGRLLRAAEDFDGRIISELTKRAREIVREWPAEDGRKKKVRGRCRVISVDFSKNDRHRLVQMCSKFERGHYELMTFCGLRQGYSVDRLELDSRSLVSGATLEILKDYDGGKYEIILLHAITPAGIIDQLHLDSSVSRSENR